MATTSDEDKLVAEYAYIAQIERVPLREGETHESVARSYFRLPGGRDQLWLAVRKLWGKN